MTTKLDDGPIVPPGTCWHCLHSVSGPPNWRFVHRMRNLIPDGVDDEANEPHFWREDGSPTLVWLPHDMQAHEECHWLFLNSVPVPDSVDELTDQWDDDEGDGE